MFVLALAFGVLAVSALHSASDDTTSILHERRRFSSNHQRLSRVADDSVTTFKIALKQSGLDEGYAHIIDVSDPQSANYGKLWTPQQVASTFRPAPGAAETVSTWLTASGIGDVVERKGWLSFETSVSKAESLFNSTYYEHEDLQSGALRMGCDR